MKKPGLKDYPLSETHGDKISGPQGVPLDQITLEAVNAGNIGIEDLRISRASLLAQADIARAAGRDALAQNFERGAELIEVPQDVIMATYEMLRPGRVHSSAELKAQAEMLRDTYGALNIAEFITRAAGIYLQRGLLDE